MKPGVIFGVILAILVVIFAFYFFDADVTGELEAPDVDVSVTGGEVPNVDVEAGDVEVGTEEVTIEVPTVDIESPEEEAAEGETSNN